MGKIEFNKAIARKYYPWYYNGKHIPALYSLYAKAEREGELSQEECAEVERLEGIIMSSAYREKERQEDAERAKYNRLERIYNLLNEGIVWDFKQRGGRIELELKTASDNDTQICVCHHCSIHGFRVSSEGCIYDRWGGGRWENDVDVVAFIERILRGVY